MASHCPKDCTGRCGPRAGALSFAPASFGGRTLNQMPRAGKRGSTPCRQTEAARAAIASFRALGGGWDGPAELPTEPLDVKGNASRQSALFWKACSNDARGTISPGECRASDFPVSGMGGKRTFCVAPSVNAVQSPKIRKRLDLRPSDNLLRLFTGVWDMHSSRCLLPR